MTVVRATRAGLLALVLVWLSAWTGAEAQNPCASDGCGCPHEALASECCCDGESETTTRTPASTTSPEELLAELTQGRRPAGPVLNDGGCRKTRRALLELRSSVPSAHAASQNGPRLPSPVSAPASVRDARPDSFEPEPSTPPPRRARA